MDRRKRAVLDEAGVAAKFGVPPESLPDYLALVGDSADGYPGLPGFGAKTAAAVLSRWKHFEQFPETWSEWAWLPRGGQLWATFKEGREAAYLFRDLATLRDDEKLFDDVDSLRWKGPAAEFEAMAEALEQPALWKRAQRVAERRTATAEG
jgi:5'-3' exonuclease